MDMNDIVTEALEGLDGSGYITVNGRVWKQDTSQPDVFVKVSPRQRADAGGVAELASTVALADVNLSKLVSSAARHRRRRWWWPF
jgi:hypothetical protein